MLIFHIFQKSNFGIDLDGSNFGVFSFPAKFLLLPAGPKKYITSNSKFIVVQRGPEAEIVTINTVLPYNSFDICLHGHLR